MPEQDEYVEIAEGSRLSAEVGRPEIDELLGFGLVRGRGAYGKKPNRSVISRIAQTQPVSVHHYDEAEDKATIEIVQNVNPIVEAAKEYRSSGGDGYTPSRDMRHVAFIPLSMVHELLKRGINVLTNEDWPKVAHMLDSNEFAALRTGGGKISRRPLRDYAMSEGRQKR